ncbi:hypothetical protein B0H13DRAFT_1589461 [Mycena leptocephala]|nr:hypothetical protein B0H13DRAFT_1589461 [Mycena leptocephala]
MVVPVFTNALPAASSTTTSTRLELRPSPLRPACPAAERTFMWRGVNDAFKPPVHIDNPIIAHLASLASRASLKDTASYGSALRKFHLFADIFTIPESDRLPASFELLHSFALWAASDLDDIDPEIAAETAFEPVSVKTDLKRIDWSIRSMANLQKGKRTRPLRPPITLNMLRALRAVLNLDDPFDACIWVMACCAFWGMMRFGQCSVQSRNSFDGHKHLKREDCHKGLDQDGKFFARLDLLDAKTALPGEIQHVYLVAHFGGLADSCPIGALRNLKRVVPAGPKDPLFSWRDSRGDIRPMVRQAALDRINAILGAWGFGTAFGHLFRIGGASYYLAQKVSPEIIRLVGRWRSLAYEAYLRALELCISRHIGSASLSWG